MPESNIITKFDYTTNLNTNTNLNFNIQVQMNSSLCMGCGHSIKDQYIYKVQPDMQWHESCLKCYECHVRLEENSTCFIRNNKAYCKQDYTRLFTAKCHKCSLSLKRNDLVMKSKSKVYHLECFCCVICCKKLMPGEEYYQSKEGHLYCKEDSMSILYNPYTSNPMTYQHLTSTMSITPENSVTSSSFSPCNGSSSSSSSLVDSPNFTVYANNPSIQQQIQNKFAENDSYQDKEEDNSVSDEESNQNNDDLDDDDDQDVSISDDDESFNETTNSSSNKKHKNKQTTSSNQKTNHHKKIKLNNFNTSSPNYLQNCFTSTTTGSNSSTNSSHSSSGKPARIRTVLNEKQLHTLRACYGANPRPDALMKEQLVEMTGLNPRVIRVWFQNKRCKDKKKNMLIRPSNDATSGGLHIPIGGQFNHHVQSNGQLQMPTHPMFDSCF